MDNPNGKHLGLIILTLAYPLTHYIFIHIPNPVVPSANLALNMIFPILAGYFYGPLSGAIAGAVGTGLSALAGPDMYDALSILPHALMGYTAGLAGESQSQFAGALSIIIGHLLNILFYWRFGLIPFEHVGILLLGLLTETTIDVVAIILLIVFLQKPFYRDKELRW
ncbi:MAG: ECF transporter S component [Anaerolineales bacterium]